jgi:hypothetical protein
LGERARFAAVTAPEADAEPEASPDPNPEARGILRVLEKELLFTFVKADVGKKAFLKKVFVKKDGTKLFFAAFELGFVKGSTDDFIFGFGSNKLAIGLL